MIFRTFVDTIDPEDKLVWTDGNDGKTYDGVYERLPEFHDREVESMYVSYNDFNARVYHVTLEKEPRLTNFQYIASSVEAMAEFMSLNLSTCGECPIRNYCYSEANYDRDWECHEVWASWLGRIHR